MPGSSENFPSSSKEMPGSSEKFPSYSKEMRGENCKCLSPPQATRVDVQEDISNRRQGASTAWIDALDTPLRRACTCRQLEIVKLQLHETRMNGKTASLALDIAAGNGDLKTVEDLWKNNPRLFHLMNSERHGLAAPVVRASNRGHREVARFLFDETPPEVLLEGDSYWATCLLLDAVFYGFLDIALELLRIQNVPYAYLAVTRHPRQRSSPLRFLALRPDLFRSHCDLGYWQGLVYSCIDLDPTEPETSKLNRYQRLFWMTLKCLPKWFGIKQIQDLKDKHFNAHKLLQTMCKAFKDLPDIAKDRSWKDSVYEALLEAVENGNVDFFIEIINCNPELLWIFEAVSGRNLFHQAVEFRKEKILDLIYGLDDRKVMLLRSCDNENNNILHIAAYLSPRSDHLSKISGSALELQRETQWFGEVKSLVSEYEVVQKNDKNMTPRQVFEAYHEPLRKEGEKWMKYTATACSFVAALTATVTFQAIFTVPGGNDGTSGTPLLLRDGHFSAFIIINSLSFFASCTSVLIFLSILTARYSFDDFIVSLPRKMILGLTILCISIASMLVSYITALSSSMRQERMLVVPLKPLAGLPGVLFLMLQYPLLKEMVSSTYGKGLFHRHTKSWLKE
uniref:Ankyrin repeat-containing protein n=1 Tax=Noccaea caerulescens TaxID=107243 RepID=A0A1J3J3P8_NOCCA